MPIQIDLSKVDADFQHDFWQSVTPNAYKVDRAASNKVLDAKASLWWLDGIMASRFSGKAHMIARDAKAAAKSGTPFIKVRLYLSGSAQLHDGRRMHDLRTGAVHIIDQSRAWTAKYENHDQYSIFIPHHRVGFDPSVQPVVQTFGLSSLDGCLLHAAIRAFYDALARGEKETTGIETLVATVLQGDVRRSQSAGVVAARDQAIRFFVRNFSLGENLQAATIARTFGISRATAYRIFRAQGGLDRFRKAARLDHAYSLLAGHEVPRGQIGRIAASLGFYSTSHFSDAFLERFGVRPSAAAGLLPEKGANAPKALNDPNDLDTTMHMAKQLYARMTG